MANPREPAVLTKILVNYVAWAKVSAAVDSVLPPEIQGDDRRNYIDRLAPNDLNDMPKLYRAVVDDMIANNRLDSFELALFEQGQSNPVLRGILQRSYEVGDEGTVAADALQSIRNGTEPFLDSKTFFEGMEAARFRVCAVWVDDPGSPAPSSGIKGTGFLVAPDLVLTARHVVAGLIGAGAPTMINGRVEAPDVANPDSHARLAFVFDYWTRTSNFNPEHPPPGVRIVRPVADWLKWSSIKHAGDGITHLFRPRIEGRFDCAVIRLSEKVGMAGAGRGSRKIRGWLHLHDKEPRLDDGSAIAILQHPAGGPQVFDKGNYKAVDDSKTRVFYETEAAAGSSGSPCFDSNPTVVAFHNAGRPTNFVGPTASCNQGVRIDHVIAAMPPNLVAESSTGWSTDTALWSLSDDPIKPEPVLGRAKFKQMVLALFQLQARQRVIIVEESPDVAAVGKSGKSFSARILTAVARGRPGFVVEFSAKEIRSMAPEHFLAELGRRIGLTGLDTFPDKPTDERQLARWCASDLPQWFGQLLESSAKKNGTAAFDTTIDPARGSALGREFVLRELVWIVIDDIHRDPPAGGIKELLAGMMGITETASLVGPGLKSLRWLVIGHIPDFVRERSIEYVRDEVSQKSIGSEEWLECLETAFLSEGKQDEFNPGAAQSLYKYSQRVMPDINVPDRTLKTLSMAAITGLDVLLKLDRTGGE